jgi:hypothetical protein
MGGIHVIFNAFDDASRLVNLAQGPRPQVVCAAVSKYKLKRCHVGGFTAGNEI